MATPAMLAQVSMRPNRATAALQQAGDAAASAMSAAAKAACPPSASMAAQRAARRSRLREIRKTLAPRLAAIFVVTRPIPDVAPVTTMT